MKAQLLKILSLGLFVAITTGCAANLKPVATFGAGTSALAATYRPMVTDLEKTCLARRTEEAIPKTYGEFNYPTAIAGAAADCKEITDNKKLVQEFAVILDGYGAGLVELSGLKADMLSADIGAVSSAASKLKNASGTVLIEKAQLDLATKLATYAVEMLLGNKVKEEARKELEQGKIPLAATVHAMKAVVNTPYLNELNELDRHLRFMESRLLTGSNAVQVSGNDDASLAAMHRAIPLRMLQAQNHERIAAVARARENITKFNEAADALTVAHAELIAKFDEKTAIDKIPALLDFIKKVRDLRDSVQML
ncbi:Uncharacterised protein [Delftia tsuruhatensis]|uniref:hypothetical protein n=1 Tax=Delftia tsuruhatensis TaxID=180282 RepID=UPI001E6A590A|nr:hypothetical protein [Delftia tsuruhatensis]CAB5721093.1 Uncharacterised protein [Delftia tsuruhatensis]CAC9688064.1 Uncharacterised protein [Delftia tsuruhatensis]